jgi:cold shock CspA family protein
MKGKVLQFDKNTGAGVIEDHRGAEFPFSKDQVASNEGIQAGDQVNFRPKGSKTGPFASQIVPIRAVAT